MAKSATVLLLSVAALVTTDAHAQCLKHDCSSDPIAWGAAFGGTGSQQEDAAKAARTVVAAKQQEANAEHISTMGLVERRKLLYSLEDTLTRLSGKPATVVGATVLAKGSGYLFCGGAMYGGGTAAMFILDTRPGATATLNAAKETWIAAGCELAATTLR